MKTARSLGATLRLIAQLKTPVALATPLALGSLFGGTLLACADENDPSTWAKRLNDPAQKGAAIKRLNQFYDDASNKALRAGKTTPSDDPAVVEVLDKIMDPLTQAYTAGGLDDKTRKDLIKLLADTKDPRAQAAFAKALNDYEPGKTDEDVRFASQGIISLAKLGKLNDQPVIDALWATFLKVRISTAKLGNMVKDLHDAVLAVKHASYGPKAVAALSRPVTLEKEDEARDELEFWQLTSVQVISEMKYKEGAKALVMVLLTPNKAGIQAAAGSALQRMPKEGEAVLVAALQDKDPDIKKLIGEQYKDKEGKEKVYLGAIARSLGLISRDGARDQIIVSLAAAETVTARFELAQSLTQFNTTPESLKAFQDAYAKLKPEDKSETLQEIPAKTALLQTAAQFYDPNIVEWLAKESLGIKGPLRLVAIDSALKLMKPSQKKVVDDAMTKAEPDFKDMKDSLASVKDLLKHAVEVLDKCNDDVGCYLKVIDEPIPSGKGGANMRTIKAIYMASIFGGVPAAREKTRNDLLKRVDTVKDQVARLSLVQAIDHLAPEGDNKIADELDKIVDSDKKSGVQELLRADDAVVKVSRRLRARAEK